MRLDQICQQGEQHTDGSGIRHHRVGRASHFGRGVSTCHCQANARIERPLLNERGTGRKGREIGEVVARDEEPAACGSGSQQLSHRITLRDLKRGSDLQDGAPSSHSKTVSAGPIRNHLSAGGRGDGIRGTPPVQCHDRTLALHVQIREFSWCERLDQCGDPLLVSGEGRRNHGRSSGGFQPFCTVQTGVVQRLETEERTGLDRRATRHARHQHAGGVESLQRRPRARIGSRRSRILNDRRKRAIEIDEHRELRGRVAKWSQRRGEGARHACAIRPGTAHGSVVWRAMNGQPPSVPRTPRHSWLMLLLIGTAGGLQSGLFGVGGGAIIVPLLIVLAAYGAREAAATSIAAITVIAAAGTITHIGYGNVRWEYVGALAVPAIAGAILGAAVQQRIRKEWITLGLAVLLLLMGIDLLYQGIVG